MTFETREIAGRTCLVFEDGGPVFDLRDGGRSFVEEALTEGARVLAVPASRLDDSFFELKTGIAGEALQKFVNYRLVFAIVGDVSERVAASKSLHDFVVECNRGHDVLFVADLAELEQRLTGA
jgi:hypothetical protein